MLTWMKVYKPIRFGVIFPSEFTSNDCPIPLGLSPLRSKSVKKSNTGAKRSVSKCWY